MKVLNVERINRNTHYTVFANTDDAYIFYTRQGIVYEVSFDEDKPIGGCDTYQVTIRKVNQAEGSHDPFVRDTILSIIEEFFESNQSVLLYICDTSDGRQQARNMLFLRWLRDYDTSGRYRISTCNVVVEGEMWYTAIIVRVDNPLCDTVTAEFEADASRLCEKPE